MPFDFDEYVDRTGTGSVKWAEPRNLPSNTASRPIPMWVADMDFRAPREVAEALKHAADHGIFGYDEPRPSFYEAVVQWQRVRFGWTTPREWIVLAPGVVPALFYIIQAFSQPGDGVLMQMPVYGPFHLGAKINGRRVIGVPLEWDGNRYGLDIDRFRAAIAKDTKLFILCNPHNPVGKVWTEPELRAIGEACMERDVLVVSDEIHRDFVLNPELRHIPFASLGEDFAQHSIVCSAPSKTFNLAGLNLSHLFVANTRRREELMRAMFRTGFFRANTMGTVACEAAYRFGAPWLEALLDYLRGNHAYLAQELQCHIPEIKVAPAESLFLAWLDCRGLGLNDKDLNDFMLREAGLWLNRGEEFGPGGEGHMRMNLGCRRALLEQALSQLKSAVEALRASRGERAGASRAEKAAVAG
jgi:cystathionine beta-lyase